MLFIVPQMSCDLLVACPIDKPKALRSTRCIGPMGRLFPTQRKFTQVACLTSFTFYHPRVIASGSRVNMLLPTIKNREENFTSIQKGV